MMSMGSRGQGIYRGIGGINMKTNKRVLVSFDGECPYRCKHCYTYELEQLSINRSIKEIVDSIREKEFDIIYVSQKKENFVNPNEGLELCEALFTEYHTDIVAITRNVFNKQQIERLKKLNHLMKDEGKQIFLSVSIPALDSAIITEELSVIPSPKERIQFLRDLSGEGITTFLVMRPLYPNKIIPISEILQLVDICKDFVSCVLSSGLVTNASILERLGYREEDFSYNDNGKSDYLVGAIEGDMKYIDVREEINILCDYCKKIGVPFFEHSMPAVNYIKNMI